MSINFKLVFIVSVSISVSLSADSSLIDSANSAEFDGNTTTDNECRCLNTDLNIEGLTSTSNQSIVTISWNETAMKEVEDDCKIKYDIGCEKFTYYRTKIQNHHKINSSRLLPCNNYTFTIKASRDSIYCAKSENKVDLIFHTDPENIGFLNVEFENNKTKIQWNGTLYCSNYRLYVDSEPYDLSVNKYEFPKSLYCANISVQTLTNDNKTSPLVTKSVPGEVRNLKVEPDINNSLVISWDPPKRSECVTHYEVLVNEETKVTNETLVTILEFESCILYQISVTAVAKEERGKPVTFKHVIDPKVMNDVDNLNFSEEENKLSWEKPKNQENCKILYDIKLTSLYEEKEYKFKTNNTSYVFPNIGKCMKYSAFVSSTMRPAIDSGQTILNINTEGTVPDPPVCSSDDIDKTTATIYCTIEDFFSNACTLLSIEIICTSEKQKPIIVNQTISDSENRTELMIDIDNLFAFTNYSCTSKLYNTEGPSESSDFFSFQTLQDVPSKPENFNVTNVETTSFQVNWDEPKEIPGVLETYELTINPVGPKHFIPSDCIPVVKNLTIQLNETTYHYDKALPNYQYELSIRAKTIDFGIAAFTQAQTKFAVPENVRQPEGNLKNVLGIEYCVSVEYNWLYPCQTNGEVKHFLLKLYSKPSENNKSFDENPLEFKIKPNDQIHNIDYAFEIEGIKPLHTYKATLQTILENDLASSEWEDTFDAPPGLPSAPIFSEITQASTTSFMIHWEEPINKTGYLRKYNINVTSVGPLHPVPEDCKTYTGFNSSYLNSSQTFYEFLESHPNYQYNISMAASTDAGYGQVAIDIYNSNKSAPEMVRELNFSIIMNQETPQYDVHLNLFFKSPCNLNGELMNYEVTLIGERGGKNHTNVEKSKELEYTFKLFPETDYRVTVLPLTDSSESGVPCGCIFSTKAGVPIVYNLEPTIISSQTSAVCIFSKNFFGDENGVIWYYAVLLVNANVYNDTDTYGYWDGIHWPDSGNWTDQGTIKKIQTTPDRWNPFSNSNITTISFLLGNDMSNCSEEFCNSPLRVNTTYALEIRAYTKYGYRNTNVFYFNTLPDIDKALTVIEILGIVVGVLAIVILGSGAGFYYWRRKIQTPPMVPQHFEEDIYRFAPISISAFPEYYAEIKTKPEILKTDFLAMNASSLEEVLPITIATLPENRKKNRYTNILPFDDTRVVLNSSTSDYINASYIKGFSDRVEYIATQGPLSHTVHDFWKMVIDEDVNVIVMLAQFVEQKREKCHKYFPDKNEQMEIEDIQIRCSIELDYDYFCERHFLIQYNGRKYDIVHLQFMNWPDFGCPEGTDNMLSFCLIVRKFIEEFSCKAVMHCSAGVGRTGTLIAIDILLQVIRCQGNIHVHNTVLNLRKQRKNMVQTEAQYLYIHSCINDAILQPRVLEIKANEEPIYENAKGMELKIFKSDDNENIEIK